MQLVKNGLTSKQIARELGISPRTVDQHIGTVIEVLQVNNRMAAVTRLQEIELEEQRNLDVDTHDLVVAETTLVTTDNVDAVTPTSLQPQIIEPARKSTLLLGGRTNNASRSQRLRWMIQIAILSVMVSCFIVLTIMGVSELASRRVQ